MDEGAGRSGRPIVSDHANVIAFSWTISLKETDRKKVDILAAFLYLDTLVSWLVLINHSLLYSLDLGP
jgi:hypothetical protein